MLTAALVALALDAFWLEPSSLRLSRHDVAVPDMPALKGLRIAVIADLHGGAPYIDAAKIDRVVAMTNAARPDVILLAGDYVTGGSSDSRAMPIAEIAARLRPLHAPMGVFAVLGNHDTGDDGPQIAAALRRAGITLLQNANVTLPGPRGAVILAGIDDFSAHLANPGAALQGIAPAARALCLTHSPYVFAGLSPRCGLLIAGHTHGGQVQLPLLGAIALNFMTATGQRYAQGVVREHGETLFVSTGIGTTGLPVRFGVPPEISVLTIH